MALKLQFLSRSRLWAEVVVSAGERVFVPTPELPAVGSTVHLEIELPELQLPIQAHAVVQQHRPANAGLPAGILLKLDAPSLEKCRALVADHEDGARLIGRGEPRADCDLPARVLNPRAMSGCHVKSLSLHGLTLRTPEVLEKDANTNLAVQLPDGSEMLINAQVLWSRPDLTLSGLKIGALDSTAQARLESAIEVLLGRKSVGPSSARLVLVADDDPSILEFTSRVVTKAGHRVVQAERGDTALELMRRERPAMAFLDVLMPGLDGLEVCSAIRRDAALSRTPVVLLSAMGEDRLAAAAKAARADGYLTKPMRLEAVRALLSTLLRR